jgi:hypothetical protein
MTLSAKTAATTLYIFLSPSATFLHTIRVRKPTSFFPILARTLLTSPYFMPYNIRSLYSHGLIRRLGRLLSDLSFGFTQDMLSFEMGPAVGVLGLSVEPNDVSFDTIRVMTAS